MAPSKARTRMKSEPRPHLPSAAWTLRTTSAVQDMMSQGTDNCPMDDGRRMKAFIVLNRVGKRSAERVGDFRPKSQGALADRCVGGQGIEQIDLSKDRRVRYRRR